MATRRTEIQVVVLGLADLQAMNTSLGVHDKRLQGLTNTYLAFNAAVSGASGGMKQFITNNQTINNTLNQTDNTLRGATVNITKMGAAAGGANNQFGGFLGTMLQYRAVSLVFERVTKAIGATVQAMADMEKQAARVQRVSAPGSTPGIRADIAVEASRTGADIKDIGEAYYQLKTQVRDNTSAFSALQTAMNLVVGTESDARDTARAMLQVYNQFGDQLGQNVGQSEKLRRAGELLATMWKGSAAEVSEITSALKYLGPVAESAHVPLEQVAAVLSALTFEGVRGRMGGTEAAQLIAQMIKNFDLATGYIKNKGATLKAGLTLEGGLDIVQTMKNFNEVASHMPTQTAEKFSQAISGSMNAWRLFGTVNPEFLRILQQKMEDATKATHGFTHETDELRKSMLTTEQEGKRAFGGLFAFISQAVDVSPLRGWLHGIADDLQRLVEASRVAHQVLDANQAYSAGVLAPGAPVRPAVEDTQRLVRQALSQVRTYERLPTFQQLGRTELDAATAGMTPAERDMIRARYLPDGNTLLNLNQPAMVRDLGIMLRQLDDPSFGIGRTAPGSPGFSGPTQTATGGSGGGLRGLTRAQMENAAIIAEVARRHGIDPTAMIAVAYAESGISNRDINPTSGATGLFQFLHSTRPDIDRQDPRQNAEAAAQEITRRMSGHGPIPPGLEGAAAAQWMIENFERPGAAGVRGDMSRVRQFYAQHVGGGSALGSYTPPPDKDAQRAEDERERKAAAILDQRAKTAQIEYEHLKQQFGDDDTRTAAAAKRADALAAAAGDADERLRLRYGLSGNVVANTAGALQERKDRLDAAKEAADAARELYGKGGPNADLVQTSLFPFPKAAIEAFQGRPDVQKGLEDYKSAQVLKQDQIDKVKEATQSINEYNESVAQQIGTAMERSISARERGLRPNMLGGGLDTRQESILTGNIADMQRTLTMLKTVGGTADQIADWKEKLLIATAALVDFHDTLDQKAYSKRVQAEQDTYELRNQEIEHLHKLKFNKDEDAAAKDAVQKYRQLIVSAEQNLADVTALGGGQQSEDVKRKAQKDLDAARQNLTDYQIDAKMQKYQNAYSTAKGEVSSTLMTFFHGQGSIGDVFKGLGGTIVDASLQSWIKKYSDPLIQTVTSEILAIQGNTDALSLLTTTMSGGAAGGGLPGSAAGSGFGAVVAAGVAAGIAGSPWGNGTDANGSPVSTAGAGTKGGKGSQNQSDLQKGIGAGLAAYSIFSTGQQQGVNAGNLLGGILSGASIGASIGGPVGGAIGAAAGGLFDIIGGLFHQRSKPTATPQDLNPAYYNAPSNFDVAAYNYSAYGKLPTVANVGFAVKPANAPIVNVFVDGARVAARQEISNQTTLATISLANTTVDRHAPV